MKRIFITSIIFFFLILAGCSNDKEKSTPPIEDIYSSFDGENTLLVNNIDGYKVNIYGEFVLDTTLEVVRTRLTNSSTSINVYYDDFKKTIHNKETYFSYGNQSVLNDKEHKIIKKENFKKNGFHFNIIKWKRESFKHLENDFPFYTSIEVAINKNEVFTFLINSKELLSNKQKEIIISSFEPIDKTFVAKNPYFHSLKKNWNEETENYFDNNFGETSSLKWGLFNGMKLNDNKQLEKLESKVDYEFDTLLRYQIIGEDTFPTDEMNVAYKEGKTIQLTMQYDKGSNVLYELLDGKYDKYLEDYAKNIKNFNHPILFRLNNEMNGDWVKYSAIHTSKDSDIYIAAWHYIYNLFEKYEVNNLIWVWNPNHHSKPDFKWNHTLLYYPGSEYVDVIGLTAYNTGDYYEGEVWTDFETLYDEIYFEYIKWFEHPFMISEFASSSIGGDKSKWIDDMFDTIHKYERVKMAIWWSWQDFDAKGKPSRIYFMDENNDTLDSFKDGLSE